jgi:Fe2+ or Zn2+ uptake regulation protein
MSQAMHDYWKASLRLTLLRLLAEQPGYQGNSSVLTQAADASAGFSCSRDQVKTELAWLAEQGLVTTTETLPGLVVAKLSERGGDVAAGRAIVPGVQKPGP